LRHFIETFCFCLPVSYTARLGFLPLTAPPSINREEFYRGTEGCIMRGVIWTLITSRIYTTESIQWLALSSGALRLRSTVCGRIYLKG